MPDQVYQVNVDGKSYEIHWSRPNAPTNDDFNSMVSGIRGSSQHASSSSVNLQNQINSLSSDLGITPAAARSQGVVPAVQQAQNAPVQTPGATPFSSFMDNLESRITGKKLTQQDSDIVSSNIAGDKAEANPGNQQAQNDFQQIAKKTNAYHLAHDQFSGNLFNDGVSGLTGTSIADTTAGINDTPGLSGTAAKVLSSIAEPQNLAMMAAVPFLHPVVQKLAQVAFSGVMGKAAVDAAHDTDLLKSDPAKYIGNIVAAGGMAALPILHSAMGGLSDTADTAINGAQPADGEGTTASTLPTQTLQDPVAWAKQQAIAEKTQAVKDAAGSTPKILPNDTQPIYSNSGGTPVAGELPGSTDTINQNQSPRVPDDSGTINPISTSDLQKPGFGDLIKQAGDKARNFFVENFSGMGREAPDSAAASVQYASSNDIAKVNAMQAIPKVLSGLSEDDAARFQTYLVADSIANLRSQMIREGASPKELNQLAKLNDPVDGTPINLQKLEGYFSQPDVASAVDAHKAEVQPLLDANRIASGYEANGTTGKFSDAWTPKLALDENGEPYPGGVGQGTNWTQPKGKLSSVPGVQAFTGTADAYEPDYTKAITDRLSSGTRAANQRQMIVQYLKDGIAVPEGDPSVAQAQLQGDNSPQLYMQYKGNAEPASVVDLSGKFGWNGSGNLDLPQRVVMPNRFVNEMNPLFDTFTPDSLGKIAYNVNGAAVGAYLRGVGEAISHTFSLSSRLSNAQSMLSQAEPSITNLVMRTAGPIRSLANWANVANLGDRFTPEDKVAAIQELAKVGRLPRDFGEEPAPLSDNPVVSKVQQFGHFVNQTLNGPNGAVVNAATTIYKWVDGLPGGVDGNQPLLRQMLGELNANSKALRPQLQTALQKTGLGSFYQTGMRNRVSAFNQPLPYVAAGLLGTIATQLAMFKATDPQHRDLWQVPGAKLGEVTVGHQKNGAARVLNVNFLDKTQGYADYAVKSILGSISNQDTAIHGAENLAADTFNQVSVPAFSGPTAGVFEGATGISPSIQPSDDLRRPSLVSSNAGHISPLDPRRALAVVSGALPQVGAGEQFIPGTERNQIDDPKVQALSTVMRLLGLPSIHAKTTEADSLKFARKQERSMIAK